MTLLRPGDPLEGHVVEAVLSSQGGAVVYAAKESETGRTVAITVLSAETDAPSVPTRVERAERAAGLARLTRVEPIATGKLDDGSTYVVNERETALPIITRSPAPIGAVFGAMTAGSGPMDPGRAMLSLTSERARRRAGVRLARLGLRALALVVIALAIAWLLAAR